MITIVDYGMGNLGSISNMLKKVGAASRISSSEKEISEASKLILPGVGAFDSAMARIASSGLRRVLDYKATGEKIPVLGICLGMQLLTVSSEEGTLPGLGWISARTLGFRQRVAESLRIPHMGWNLVSCARPSALTREFTTLEEVRFYFVHSYFVRCDSPDASILRCEYGVEFDAGVQSGNIYGVQFHPEKSHRFGMRLLENFANL